MGGVIVVEFHEEAGEVLKVLLVDAVNQLFGGYAVSFLRLS